MGQPVHTIESPTGFVLQRQDRILIGNLPNQATVVGASAGAAVVKTFTGLRLPPVYTVLVGSTSMACSAVVSAKTVTGFTVTLTPLSTSVTLAAGTIDLTVVA